MPDAAMPPVPDHEDRMKAARAYARWHLGYDSWADNIVNAYLNPAMARAGLRASRAQYETPAPATTQERSA